MSILLGSAATAGLDVSALGLTLCNIPAGTYDMGDAEYEDNPPRRVELDAFELAKAPATNWEWAAALQQLGDQNTVLMVESEMNRRWTVVARGTKREVANVETGAIREVLSTMRLSGGQPARRTVGDFAVEGALRAFELGEQPVEILPVTLSPHLVKGFDGGRQPAWMSYFEAAAVAALYGLILPVGEQWEAASGDLRNRRYWDERELRKVAHFRPAEATAEVGTKEPNKYGLHDMLGNVWEWMANRLGENTREVRGGSWDGNPGDVRAAFRLSGPPGYWGSDIGCRFGRLSRARSKDQDSRG